MALSFDQGSYRSSFTLAVPGLRGLPVEGILADSVSDAMAQAGQSRSE